MAEIDTDPVLIKLKACLGNQPSQYQKFTAFNSEGIRKMLKKIHGLISDDMRLQSCDLECLLGGIIHQLDSKASMLKRGMETMASWPENFRFFFLDILRLEVAANYKTVSELHNFPLPRALFPILMAPKYKPTPPYDKMLALEVLCNMFGQEGGQRCMLQNTLPVLKAVKLLYHSEDPMELERLCALMYNYVKCINERSQDWWGSPSVRLECLSSCVELLPQLTAPHNQYNLAFALEILLKDEECMACSAFLNLRQILQAISDVSDNASLRNLLFRVVNQVPSAP